MIWRYFAEIFLFIIGSQLVSSKTCTQQSLYYVPQHYCASSFLWWCSSHGYRRLARYRIKTVCCPGYGGEDCNTPICNPPCNNGGTCTAPNTCACPQEAEGSTCQTVTCSHVKPCFPGTCSESNTCTCDSDFGENSCLKIRDTQQAEISGSNTILMKVRRSDSLLFYKYIADSKSNYESIWVNEKDYNYFLIYFSAFYYPPHISSVPPYVGNYSIGIVSAYVRVVQTKVNRDGGEPDLSLNHTISCPGNMSTTTPVQGALKCNISYDQYDKILENGDNLTVISTAEIGGFRDLIDLNDKSIHERNYFTKRISKESIVFHFDFVNPWHCSSLKPPCSFYPFHIQQDATKEPLVFIIEGWSDTLSGVHRYTLEVHKLQKDPAFNYLVEPSPMQPLYHTNSSASNISFPQYTPPEAGVYSIILQVTDRANNSVFVRQLAIYDPESNITVTEESNLKVTSAEMGSNFEWQSDTSSITVSWDGYFQNSFQVKNNFLLGVAEFPVQRRGGEVDELKNDVVKEVVNEFDDHDGLRTTAALNHVHGITGFEVAYIIVKSSNDQSSTPVSTLSTLEVSVNDTTQTSTETELTESSELATASTESMPITGQTTGSETTTIDATNGVLGDNDGCRNISDAFNIDTPIAGWRNIVNISDEQFSFNHNRNDGDSIIVWVKARDIMNNSLVASRIVSFDTTEPILSNGSFHKNVHNATHEYSSRISVKAHDDHSGIKSVRWRLLDHSANTSNTLFKEGHFQIEPLQTCCRAGHDCYCIPKGQCFQRSFQLDFNNCWLTVDKNQLMGQSFTLELVAVNQATLTSHNITIQISNLTTFNGIDSGSGITDLKVNKTTSDSVTYQWKNVPSCYKRGEIKMFVYADCDKSKPPREIVLPSSATEYTVTGLKSGSQVCVNVQVNYTDGNSDSIRSLDAPTVEKLPTVIPVAMISAVSAVIAILLGIILIGIILWRTGQLKGTKQQIKKRITQYLERPLTTFGLMPRRKTGVYSGRFADDDIYAFGEMMFDQNEGWLFNFDDITLKGKLTSGYFADIYLAQLQEKDLVVAKILKEGFTEEDRLVLQAKISFHATQVESHPNVLQFIGSVINHPEFGPYMLLEYCELGQLRTWLINSKNKVNDAVITEFCQIIQGIAKGMESLAQKGIVHRRLATRNVLLTTRMVPKVYGFGPTPEEGKNDKDIKAGLKRTAIKWLAPECFDSLQNCSTKSDVWAFGILQWEVFSTGQTPYSDMDNKVVPLKLKGGYRMATPEFCPDTHEELMKKCWHQDADERPSFTDIVSTLDNLYEARFPCDDYTDENAV